jgi:hypothetical protein
MGKFRVICVSVAILNSAAINRIHYHGRHSRAGGNLKALALRLFISKAFMSTPWFTIDPIAIGLGMTILTQPAILPKKYLFYIDFMK